MRIPADLHSHMPKLFLTTLIGLVTLTFDLSTSQEVNWLLVWWASILPIMGFLGLSVLELGRGMRQTDRHIYRHRASFYNAPAMEVGGVIISSVLRITPGKLRRKTLKIYGVFNLEVLTNGNCSFQRGLLQNSRDIYFIGYSVRQFQIQNSNKIVPSHCQRSFSRTHCG